jgi:hypothetical protein
MYVTSLPPLLRLRSVGDHRYEGMPEHDGSGEIARNVIHGGQILTQMIMAAPITSGSCEVWAGPIASRNRRVRQRSTERGHSPPSARPG